MGRILGTLLLVCVAIYALQLALVLLFLAGLIFRTKETLSILLVFGVLGLVSNYPIPCLVVGGAAVLLSLYLKRGEREIGTNSPPELTDETHA